MIACHPTQTRVTSLSLVKLPVLFSFVYLAAINGRFTNTNYLFDPLEAFRAVRAFFCF